jgi:hypothetical protein
MTGCRAAPSRCNRGPNGMIQGVLRGRTRNAGCSCRELQPGRRQLATAAVFWKSTHEKPRRRSARSSGQRLAGMPRLERLGSVASGAAAVAVLPAACSVRSGYGFSRGVGRTTSAGPATTAVVGIRASGPGPTLTDSQGRRSTSSRRTRRTFAGNGACAADRRHPGIPGRSGSSRGFHLPLP